MTHTSPNTSVVDMVDRGKKAVEHDMLISADLQATKDRGRTDFNFFAGLCAPRIMRTLFPPFYLALFNLLIKGNDDPYYIMRFALGLPRGFAKTTFLKIVVCWLIVYDKNFYILVVCASEGKALSFISDVDAMLSSPNMESVYGKWSQSKSIDNAKLKVGVMNGRARTLHPAGSQSDIRGSNLNLARPDCIICDDVQSREDALSEATNASQRDWFTATLIKSIETYGANRLVIYLGNMYPGDCLLEMLRKNPKWVSLVTGAILDDGDSLWPELKPVRVLLEEYEHDAANGQSHIWFAEVQNDPLNELHRLLAKPIPDSPYAEFEDLEHDAAFITIDPAGFRKNSDDNVIATHLVYDNHPVVSKLEGGIWNPEETVLKGIAAAIEVRATVIAVESTAYQQSLLFWFEKYIKELNITWIHVVELKTGNATKLSRIRDFITELAAGNASMLPAVRQVFSYWAHLYKIGKKANRDDYLDAPAYQKQVMMKYSDLLYSKIPTRDDLKNLPDVIDVDAGY